MKLRSGEPEYTSFRLKLVRDGITDAYFPHSSDLELLAAYAHRLLAQEPAEVLGAFFLDGLARPFGHVLPFRGKKASVGWEAAGIFAPALLANAYSIILFHNHPSGLVQPSKEDLTSTEQLCQAGMILGVPVLDHLIVGSTGRWGSIARHLRQDSLWSPQRQMSIFGSSLRPIPAARVLTDRRHHVRPKYRNPDNASETWAGRGMPPKWLNAKLMAGASMDDFRIEKTTTKPR